jgi:hypothetical protein
MNSDKPMPEGDRLVWADPQMDDWGPILILAAQIEMGAWYCKALDAGHTPERCWEIAEAAGQGHLMDLGRADGLEEPGASLATRYAEQIPKIARRGLEPRAARWVTEPVRAKANGHNPLPYKNIGGVRAWRCSCGTLSTIVDYIESGGYGKCAAVQASE